MSQVPPYYHNVLAQTSQNNFQQHKQQQQQNNPQQMLTRNLTPFNMNQQGLSVQNQPFQPFQGEFYGNVQVPNPNLISTNPYQQNPRSYSASPGMQNQNHYGSLPQSVMDQFRSCMNSAAPIFILPNACSNPSPTTPQMQQNSMTGQNMGYPMNYPPMGMPFSPPQPFCYPPPCVPYALPYAPIYNQISSQDRQKEKSHNCECCQRSTSMKETLKNANIFIETEDHKCKGNRENDVICPKKNCPSALHLQALASQLLSNQGVIPAVATRLVLQKVPGCNITTSVDETICRAQNAINQLNKDQLLTECRNAQQVNALINLHMTANPPINVIPILTMIQLKVNLLKAQVENLINKKLMENQGVGAEGAGNLDPLVLALKTDAELREFLAALRDKECQERVNFNFAPYHAQRVIAESHLTNIQKKISQVSKIAEPDRTTGSALETHISFVQVVEVEAEMERRRSNWMPRTSIVNRTQYQFSNPCSSFNNSTYVGSQMHNSSSIFPTQTYESPDPFIIQVRSPKRLNLKPHVGSPETTYQQPKEAAKDISKQIQKDDNCPSSSFSTSLTKSNLEEEKKLQKNVKTEDHPMKDLNDNQLSDSRSSSNLHVTVDNKKSETKLSSKFDEVSLEVDNIPSKELSDKSNSEDKKKFKVEKKVDLESGNQEKRFVSDSDLKKSDSEESNESTDMKEILLNDDFEEIINSEDRLRIQGKRNISTIRIEITGDFDKKNDEPEAGTSHVVMEELTENQRPKKYVSTLSIARFDR